MGYTDRGEYSKLFINNIVVPNTNQQEIIEEKGSTEETPAHGLDYGLVLPLAILLAMVLVVLVVIKRLRKRGGSSL